MIEKIILYFVGLALWVGEHKKRITAYIFIMLSVAFYVISIATVEMLFTKYFWVQIILIALGVFMSWIALKIDPDLFKLLNENDECTNEIIITHQVPAKDYSEDFEYLYNEFCKEKPNDITIREKGVLENVCKN